METVLVWRSDDLAKRIARLEQDSRALHQRTEHLVRASRELVWETHRLLEASRFLRLDLEDSLHSPPRSVRVITLT